MHMKLIQVKFGEQFDTELMNLQKKINQWQTTGILMKFDKMANNEGILFTIATKKEAK